MSHVEVETARHLDLESLLEPTENLLWTGQPGYGKRFFQLVGEEKKHSLILFAGAAVMWCSLPLIDDEARYGQTAAIWVYALVTLVFVLVSLKTAQHRQHVLNSLLYFITDRRAIIVRRSINWRSAVRLYVISFQLSGNFPYRVISGKPYPSLFVGMLYSGVQVHPFGSGLGHIGHGLLRARISVPVTFDYIRDAGAALEIIRFSVSGQSAPPDA